jgi:hypothetical protein
MKFYTYETAPPAEDCEPHRRWRRAHSGCSLEAKRYITPMAAPVT